MAGLLKFEVPRPLNWRTAEATLRKLQGCAPPANLWLRPKQSSNSNAKFILRKL